MSWVIYQGDCRLVLRTLPAESVQVCCTSPPYWGLRAYGTESQVWGGDPVCAHAWGDALPPKPGPGNAPDDLSTSSLTNPERQRAVPRPADAGRFCGRCGAWRGELGLEPTPQLYVEHIVEVFREVWRVLRPDGTFWLNLGDSYAGQRGGFQGTNGQRASRTFTAKIDVAKRGDGLKPKDLVGIPWRVAFALQADGWWLRAENIWQKPNPMPESVRDRPTRAHEQVFLLTKSERYFYDADAVQEDSVSDHDSGNGFFRPERISIGTGNLEQWVRQPKRNRRSVWSIATRPCKEAHFATFPPDLPEICILAGSSERGACVACGAPWERVIEAEVRPQGDVSEERGVRGADGQKPLDDGWEGYPRGTTSRKTIGWRPTCNCETGGVSPVPCSVLDPFAGACTTGLVARRLGRSFIGIELNREYVTLGERRIVDDAPLLNTAAGRTA